VTRAHAGAAWLAISLISGLVGGCASAARDDVAAARARYEQCVAAASERECGAEKERLLAAERAYQEQAQRAWGCNPTHSDCPPRR
jgi:hypothetical protein